MYLHTYIFTCAPGLKRHEDEYRDNPFQLSFQEVECTVLGDVKSQNSQALLLSSIVKVSIGPLLRALISFRRLVGVKMWEDPKKQT